jgi:predicted small lipoprotein YifL
VAGGTGMKAGGMKAGGMKAGGMKAGGMKAGGMKVAIALLLAVGFALAACGKVGPPQPAGPADKITWPRAYPKPSTNGY